MWFGCARAYFEVTEEGGGVLQVALYVEGDHPWTPGALSLHELVLRVRRQTCAEREDSLNLFYF